MAGPAVLCAAYFGAARMGLAMDAVSGFATLVWPPTGIALAALLLWGYRLWPGIAAGAFLANASIGAPLGAAFGIAVGNTLEAVVGACLLRGLLGFRNDLDRLRDVLGLILLGAGLSTTVSATLGVGSLWMAGVVPRPALGLTWRAWWVGDMLGALVVAPLLLVLFSGGPARPRHSGRLAEGFLLALSLGWTNWLVFWKFSAVEINNVPISYLVFVPLIWAALRFGPRGGVLATCVTSALAIGGTARGLGPFAREALSESLLFLQAFMGVVVVTTMTLAAAVAERARSERRARQSEEELRRARDQLEATVQERTRQLRMINEELRAEIVERKRSHEELKAAQWRLIQAEKMETVGRLAAGVAHEVKNPLSIILLGLQYLTKARVSWDRTAVGLLEDMSEAVRRADAVVKGLMDFSAPREMQLKEEPLNGIVEQSLQMVRHLLSVSHIAVRKELQEPLPLLRLDRSRVEQVFVNLIMNAIQAMPGGGTLTVRTRAGGEGVVADVEDTGTGILEEKLSKVFDPFFTTKPTGKGTGLGLSVTKHILDLHGAEIAIENRREGGVRATLRFKG
ncbi:MAG: MASE1 domain-containing protein [Candidatus Omnitrophica bacterium]|nr:MASE1 domain-containing protein [Candidatus Omnitrophota bacterium]